MNIIRYFTESFRRKKARRITREYPAIMQVFNLEREGSVEFANWNNPLFTQIVLNQPMIDFFRKFIKEGDLVIDIGSNVGDTTVPMALAAGKEGITLGFEPNPYVYKILQNNASLNKNKTNIIPLPYAISAEEDEYYYISSEASFSNGGISPTKTSAHGNFVYPEKIRGVNLKLFLEKEYASVISRLSFIKVDTEGYDKEIIKSIADLIAKYRPVIVAESFGNNTNAEKIELFTIIADMGYDIFYFYDFDSTAEIVPLKQASDLTNYKQTINIYAVPKG